MARESRDGCSDGLVPMRSLDVGAAGDLPDLLEGMAQTALGGRALGEAFDVLQTMVRDPDCVVVLTMTGAMTSAKMGRILCDMIEQKMVDIVVSTGALMAHGLSEAMGGIHFQYDASMSDDLLYKWGYNRIYDTLELESNLAGTERLILDVLSSLEPAKQYGSAMISELIGKRLVDQGQMPSVLGCAYERKVPIYVPAFTDSVLGLAFATTTVRRNLENPNDVPVAELFDGLPSFNPYVDLYDYYDRTASAKRLGIFTIGGGVPRNWGQQVAPFAEAINEHCKMKLRVPRFQYGVRICPEPVHWGGLSGCTYSEGKSWGKFVPEEEGGRFAEVLCDATIAWPILAKALMEAQARQTGRAQDG